MSLLNRSSKLTYIQMHINEQMYVSLQFTQSFLFAECDIPPFVNNITLYGNTYAVGNKVKYTCNEDHMITIYTTNIATCQPNGVWSGTNFTCTCESFCKMWIMNKRRPNLDETVKDHKQHKRPVFSDDDWKKALQM